jgi:hypothetical protein
MTYSDEVLADTPVGYWKLNEGTGTAVDSSGNSHDGTYNATVSTVTGPKGLDGSVFSGQQRVAIPHHADFDLTTFTIEAWVYIDDVTISERLVVGKAGGDSGADDNYAFWVANSTDGTPWLTVALYGEVGFAVGATSGYLTAGWHHVAITLTDGAQQFYLNGGTTWETGGSATTAVTLTTNANDLHIGWGKNDNGTASSIEANGTYANVAIYDSVLSGARILAHYEAADDSAAPPSTSFSGLDWRPVGGLGQKTGGAVTGGATIIPRIEPLF